MFKDELKTKYKEFGSLGDTIIKSNELDIPIRLYTFLRAYNLLDEYINLYYCLCHNISCNTNIIFL